MFTKYITGSFEMSVTTICCKHPEVKDYEFCLQQNQFNWYRKKKTTWTSTGFTNFLSICSDFFVCLFLFKGLTRGIY